MKKPFIIPALIIAAFIFVTAAFLILKPEDQEDIVAPAANYRECVAQGGTVQESYPPVCVTEDGESFTQDIGNETEKHDLIRIDNPRPGQEISSPLEIRGEARGAWFFEATFPVKLLDASGNIIAESFVESGGEWMTPDFVPFAGVLEFETEESEGTLILEKSNPSGLEHNADQLEIPVYFAPLKR